jgi:hypothetical protein
MTECNLFEDHVCIYVDLWSPIFKSRLTQKLQASKGIIVAACGLDDWGAGVRVPEGPKIVTFSYRPGRFWGKPSLLSNGYGDFSSGRQGRKGDRSPPASVEVKKIWTNASSPYTPSWQSAELAKHRNNFCLLPQSANKIYYSQNSMQIHCIPYIQIEWFSDF